MPPRFGGLGPTLDSLTRQAGAARVVLTLPCSFDRFPGPVAPPPLPGGVTLLRPDADPGPAAKWLGPLGAGLGRGGLLICDDDWIYGPGWAAGFAAAARAAPGHAIAASSFDAARIGAREGTVVQGFAGVLFSRAMLPDPLPPMPPEARLVDDVWLSGLLAAAGTPVRTVPALRALCRPSGNEAAPLQTATDRAGLNRACVGAVRRGLGAW